MSADNWTRCPRCDAKALAALEKKTEDVDAAYGKVPVDEFDAMRAQLAVDSDAITKMRATFREDYSFVLADNVLVARYRGSCGVCKLKVDFDAEHPFKI